MKRIQQVFLALAVLSALPLTTQATSFVMMSPADMTTAADMILVGRVEAITAPLDRHARFETLVTLAIDEALKNVVAERVDVAIPGGVAGNVRRVVYGAPQFFLGERVVLFVRQRPDGVLTTVGLGMGKYSIIERASGAVVRRQLGGDGTRVFKIDRRRRELQLAEAEVDEPLSTFLNDVRQQVGIETAPETTPLPVSPEASMDGASAPFTYLGISVARWPQPALSQNVQFTVVPTGDPTLGPEASFAAVEEAMAAWNSAGSKLHLETAGTAAAARYNACDGQNTIQFNDPFGEIGPAVNCGGVLAMGGFCSTDSAMSNDEGITYATITEADLTVNDGLSDCPYWTETNAAEIITHELGHTVGLGHSSESPREPNPTLDDATMFYMAHFDGRGAALRQDDIAAVRSLYGVAARRPRPLQHRSSVLLDRGGVAVDSRQAIRR